MKSRLSKRAAVGVAPLVALALLVPGSASAATAVCPKGYTLLPATVWYYALQDYNRDGYICLKYDKWGTPVTLTDDVIR
jgi:hypothetical protein